MNKTKQALIAISGTALQWYDFSLFGYLAPLIATLFFPETNQTAALLYTFGVFAVSYLVAPLGSVLFGYIGDNFGRKKALALSILGIAIPSSLIAILPTYEQAGIVATLLLSVFRITQGLVANAEYAGAAIYLVEHSPDEKKYFYGCLTSSAYSIGSTLAALVTAFVTASFMPSWAWRIPFLFALLGGLGIYRLRKNFIETPIFAAIEQGEGKRSFITALKHHPRSVLCTILLGLFVGIATFGAYVYATSYLYLYSKLSLSLAIVFTSAALFVDAALEPFLGLWADKWGGKKVMLLGVLGLILFSFPIFRLLSSGSLYQIAFGMAALSTLIAFSCAPLNTILVHLFPPECRYSGFGVSFNLSTGICGTVPLVMTWLIAYTHNILAPAACFVVGGFFALMGLYLLRPELKAQLSVTSSGLLNALEC